MATVNPTEPASPKTSAYYRRRASVAFAEVSLDARLELFRKAMFSQCSPSEVATGLGLDPSIALKFFARIRGGADECADRALSTLIATGSTVKGCAEELGRSVSSIHQSVTRLRNLTGVDLRWLAPLQERVRVNEQALDPLKRAYKGLPVAQRSELLVAAFLTKKRGVAVARAIGLDHRAADELIGYLRRPRLLRPQHQSLPMTEIVRWYAAGQTSLAALALRSGKNRSALHRRIAQLEEEFGFRFILLGAARLRLSTIWSQLTDLG